MTTPRNELLCVKALSSQVTAHLVECLHNAVCLQWYQMQPLLLHHTQSHHAISHTMTSHDITHNDIT